MLDRIMSSSGRPMSTELLHQIVERLRSRDPNERQMIAGLVRRATAHCAWSPNPGPQAQAFACEADELFYGGQAGGGKTDLGLGLALTTHRRSLILRRINKDAVKLVERVAQILGHRDGYNGQLQRWRLGDKLVEFAGCEHEDDKHRFKGDPHSSTRGRTFCNRSTGSSLAGTGRPIRGNAAESWWGQTRRRLPRGYG
jgi:hypothetical protein